MTRRSLFGLLAAAPTLTRLPAVGAAPVPAAIPWRGRSFTVTIVDDYSCKLYDRTVTVPSIKYFKSSIQ